MMQKQAGRQKVRTTKASGLWLLVMALFITELFFYTWCRVQCTNLGYDITLGESKIQKQNKTAFNLRIELASLRSPERIIQRAKTEFGLVIPGGEQIVVLP